MVKREVHKIKREAAKHLNEVHKQTKAFGDEAHKHVMGYLKTHLDKYVDKAVDAGGDAVAVAIKRKVPNKHVETIEKVKGTVGNIIKDKVKEYIKKPLKSKK